jgi:hypothetical protein
VKSKYNPLHCFRVPVSFACSKSEIENVRNKGKQQNTMFGLAGHLKYAVVVMAIILAIVLLSKWSGGGGGGDKTETGSDKKSATERKEGVINLMKDTQKWSTQSQNDTNPVAALVSATYAVAYLDAARSLASSDTQLAKHEGVDIKKLNGVLQERQQAAVHHIHAQCPQVI